jgi:hypothetical protein
MKISFGSPSALQASCQNGDFADIRCFSSVCYDIVDCLHESGCKACRHGGQGQCNWAFAVIMQRLTIAFRAALEARSERSLDDFPDQSVKIILTYADYCLNSSANAAAARKV